MGNCSEGILSSGFGSFSAISIVGGCTVGAGSSAPAAVGGVWASDGLLSAGATLGGNG